MTRLSRYLLRLFLFETAALFGVATFLLFLIQCLRLFDVVTDRGQSLGTLVGQALLGMPGLALVFLYVCLGIGLGRALRGLQDRNELQVIHASALLPSLLRAVAVYGLGGALLLVGFAHVLDPLAVRASNEWSASIAADLVSRSMIPRRFTKVTDGVSMIIGSRDAEGRITDFFADDDRGGLHRTYYADSAIITRDEQGFVLRMRSGGMQQMTPDKRFSEISFSSYDLPLDQLTSDTAPGNRLAQTPSHELLGLPLDAAAQRVLVNRSNETLRGIAMVLFVAGLAAFPSGRRGGPRVPVELAVMGAAFIERGIASYLPAPAPWGGVSGALLLAAVGAVVLLARLHLFSLPQSRRRPA
jgi:lipopolysaccharide export system permease protein